MPPKPSVSTTALAAQALKPPKKTRRKSKSKSIGQINQKASKPSAAGSASNSTGLKTSSGYQSNKLIKPVIERNMNQGGLAAVGNGAANGTTDSAKKSKKLRNLLQSATINSEDGGNNAK